MEESVIRTAHQLAGSRENPAVVLIHGLGLNKSMWLDYLPELAKDHFVVIYDLFGHGTSYKPQSQPSLDLFSSQLKELLDDLDISRATLIGFSLGGMINRRFAIDFPDRVESLVILNSPHERTPEEQHLVEERVRKTAQGGPAATIDTTLKRWFTADFLVSQPEKVNRVREWVLSNDPNFYAQCRFVLAAGVKELIRPQPPVRKPALVATSENDSGSTPDMTRAIAAEILGANAVIVPQLRHLGILEAPHTYLDLIQAFLKQLK